MWLSVFSFKPQARTDICICIDGTMTTGTVVSCITRTRYELLASKVTSQSGYIARVSPHWWHWQSFWCLVMSSVTADNDRAMRVMHHVVGHGPHNCSPYLSHAAGSHDDESSSFSFGHIHHQDAWFLHIHYTPSFQLNTKKDQSGNNVEREPLINRGPRVWYPHSPPNNIKQ